MILADLGNLDNEVQHSHLEDTGHLTQSDHLAGHVGGGEAGQALLGLRQSDGPPGHLLGHRQLRLQPGHHRTDQATFDDEINKILVQNTSVELGQYEKQDTVWRLLASETLEHQTSVPPDDVLY